MVGIRPGRMQDGIAQTALADIAGDLSDGGCRVGLEPVEALGKPEAAVFLERDQGREDSAGDQLSPTSSASVGATMACGARNSARCLLMLG